MLEKILWIISLTGLIFTIYLFIHCAITTYYQVVNNEFLYIIKRTLLDD